MNDDYVGRGYGNRIQQNTTTTKCQGLAILLCNKRNSLKVCNTLLKVSGNENDFAVTTITYKRVCYNRVSL